MDRTDKVVAGLIGAAIIYEGYTIVDKRKRNTISERSWPKMGRPLIPFALGMLIGHLVWQSQDVYDRYAEEEVERRKRLRRKMDQECAK